MKPCKAFGERISIFFGSAMRLTVFSVFGFLVSLNAVQAAYQKLEFDLIITPDFFPIVFPKKDPFGKPVDYGKPHNISAAELLDADICQASANCSIQAMAAGAVYYKVHNIPGVGNVVFYYDELGRLIGTERASEIPGFDPSLVGNQDSNQFNPSPNLNAAPMNERYRQDPSLVGTTEAEFLVDESGQANYSIPIYSPPVLGDMAPELAIAYNSQQGNGLLGRGFSISGLSVISRCPAPRGVNSSKRLINPVLFNNQDAFCLDGKRLVLVSGSHGRTGAKYRTEIDTFSVIEIVSADSNGPKEFKVKTRSGQELVYGSDVDSERVLLRGHAESSKNENVTFLWPLMRAKDVKNNSIHFQYITSDEGNKGVGTSLSGYRIERIIYSGVEVTFNYENRPESDIVIGYSRGYGFRQSKRLSAITVRLSAAGRTHGIRRYNISYESDSPISRISSIQECAADSSLGSGSFSRCLPAISFSWSTREAGFKNRGKLLSGQLKDWSDDTDRFFRMDFNADGYTDFLIGPEGKNGIWRLIAGSSSGLSAPKIVGKNILPTWNKDSDRIRTMDVDGDGRSEIVVGPRKGGAWFVLKVEEKFGKPELKKYQLGNYFGNWNRNGRYINPIDLNGDGRTDLLLGPDKSGNWHALLAKKEGLGFIPKTNYLRATAMPPAYWHDFVGANAPWSIQSQQLPKYMKLVDVDGDGLTDMLIGPVDTIRATEWGGPPKGVKGRWVLLKSTGTGFVYHSSYLLTKSIGLNYYCTGDGPTCSWSTNRLRAREKDHSGQLHLMDLNGDGLQDLVIGPYDGKWEAYLNTGSGFSQINSNQLTNLIAYRGWEGSRRIRPMDVDLDGLQDLLIGPAANGDWFWMKSTGNGLMNQGRLIRAHSGYKNSPHRIHLGDFDGDGQADIILSANGQGDWFGVAPKSGHSDKVIKIENGHLPETRISYRQLTEHGNIYTARLGLWPQRLDTVRRTAAVVPALWVVSSVEKGNGVGGLNKTAYQYRELRTDLDGRGILGFKQIVVADESIGETRTTSYAQKFPLTGLPTRIERKVDGKTIETVKKMYAYKKTAGSAVFPYNYWSKSSEFDLNSGAVNREIISQHVSGVCAASSVPSACAASASPDVLDAFGNVLYLQTITRGASSATWVQTTISEYPSDSEAARLARVSRVTVKHLGPDEPPIERVSSFTYIGSVGQIQSETILEGTSLQKTTSYTYDAYGLKNSVTEAAGLPGMEGHETRTSEITRDLVLWGDVHPAVKTVTKNALGEAETVWTSRLHGGVLEQRGPNGLSTFFTYDELGRQQTATDIHDVVTTTEYAWAYNSDQMPPDALYVIYTRNNVTLKDSATYYDRLGREIRSESRSFDGRKLVKETVYDHRGLISRANRPYFEGDVPVWLCFRYDSLGRPVEQDAPGAMNGSPDCYTGNRAVTKTVYNGLETLVIDPLGRGKREIRNAMDKLIRVEEGLLADGGTPGGSAADYSFLEYSYDALGNPRVITDALGKKTNLTYDAAGNKVEQADPAMGTWTYGYNAFGELVEQKDAANATTRMVYDKLGRLIRRIEEPSGNTWQWIYAGNNDPDGVPVGKLKTIIGPDGYKKELRYTAKLLLLEETETRLMADDSLATLIRSYTYDEHGRLDKTTEPGGIVLQQEYNDYGYLSAVRSPGRTLSAEAVKKLKQQKEDASKAAEAAHAKSLSYLGQAYSYQQKAIDYEHYAMALIRKQATGFARKGSEAQVAYQQWLERYKTWLEARKEPGFTAPPPALSELAKYARDGQAAKDLAAARKLYQASNDLRDLSRELIHRADQSRRTAGEKARLAASSSAAVHRLQARHAAERARFQLDHARAIVNRYINGIQTADRGTYRGASAQLSLARNMIEGAQQAYRNFQAQQSLAERLFRLAERIHGDLGDCDGSKPCSRGITWWRAVSADAEGRISKAVYGNGVATDRIYDPNTGQLLRIATGNGSGLLQDISYRYDALNNVTRFTDNRSGFSEDYQYDRLDRLTGATAHARVNGQQLSVHNAYRYNRIGDLQSYRGKQLHYDTNSGTGRLTETRQGGVKTASYRYDANGNQTHNAGRNISWTPFNKAKSLTQGALRIDYRYGPDRERQLKTVRENNRLTHSTRYFGSYEERRDAGGKVEKRYHIRAGGQIVAQLVIDDAHPLGQERYLHRDALGSVVLITDNQGQSIAEPGYSPFGQRRNLQALRNLNSHLGFGAVDIAALPSKRGFTGHEHIDEMGLIDMNGRIYDPAIGRFLSADPFVQLPKSTQGFNRYAYVQNNPLKYTDPSGYFLKSLFKSISRFINSYGSAIILAVVTGGIGYAVGAVHGAFWGGFAAGFGGTLMAGGNLRNAVSGGLFGGLSAHAASWVKGLKGFGHFGKSMMHGMAQGSLVLMRGGRFKEGFLGAFASHGMAMLAESQKWLPALSDRSGSAIALRTAFATVSGGIATELGGGKFANGAKTAAFVHLFNAEGSNIAKAIWPTDHHEISSGYDPNRKHPVSGEIRPHRAIDIVNPKGDPVYSILDGVVVEVYQEGKGSAGNYLKVDHANGLQSSYAHTGSNLSVGAEVGRGQVIGFSDGSGVGTGPHLHLSIRRNGVRINPCSVLSCP